MITVQTPTGPREPRNITVLTESRSWANAKTVWVKQPDGEWKAVWSEASDESATTEGQTGQERG